MQNIPFFFIIGRPRSGTTLLRLLFDAHPNLLIPPESPFIIVLYKKYAKVTNWHEEMIKSFCDDLFNQRYFDKWLISYDELLGQLMKYKGKSTFKDMVTQVYLAYQSVYEKKEIKMIGDKNPMYSLYADRIHKLYPDSKIIHITRDYRDNYVSLVNVNLEVPVVPLVVYRWKYALLKMWKIKKKHPDLIYSIRYEDLVTDPELHCRKLCEFLNIEYAPSMLSFYEKKSELQKVYRGSEDMHAMHKSLFNPISTEKINKWQSDMTPRQIRVADLIIGKTAEKARYKRMYPAFNPFLYLWILPSLVYASMMYQLLMLGDKLPYTLRNKLYEQLGIFLKLYWRFNKSKLKPMN